jgi:hypothetical protein
VAFKLSASFLLISEAREEVAMPKREIKVKRGKENERKHISNIVFYKSIRIFKHEQQL